MAMSQLCINDYHVGLYNSQLCINDDLVGLYNIRNTKTKTLHCMVI